MAETTSAPGGNKLDQDSVVFDDKDRLSVGKPKEFTSSGINGLTFFGVDDALSSDGDTFERKYTANSENVENISFDVSTNLGNYSNDVIVEVIIDGSVIFSKTATKDNDLNASVEANVSGIEEFKLKATASGGPASINPLSISNFSGKALNKEEI